MRRPQEHPEVLRENVELVAGSCRAAARMMSTHDPDAAPSLTCDRDLWTSVAAELQKPHALGPVQFRQHVQEPMAAVMAALKSLGASCSGGAEAAVSAGPGSHPAAAAAGAAAGRARRRKQKKGGGGGGRGGRGRAAAGLDGEDLAAAEACAQATMEQLLLEEVQCLADLLRGRATLTCMCSPAYSFRYFSPGWVLDDEVVGRE